MEQFVAVATAHLVALAIPGVDFLLITRTALISGRHSAYGVSIGIATANGVLIGAAFSGLSMISNESVITVIQLLGGGFLGYIGTRFLLTPVASHVDAMLDTPSDSRGGLVRSKNHVLLGVASGLLNPKNVLFYISLSTALLGASRTTLLGYGLWMTSVVLVWDLAVAHALGSSAAGARFGRWLPWMTKAAGTVLVAVGAAMVVGALR